MKRFCTVCGSQMVFEKEETRYNAETGNPEKWITLKCPRYDTAQWNDHRVIFHDTYVFFKIPEKA